MNIKAGHELSTEVCPLCFSVCPCAVPPSFKRFHFTFKKGKTVSSFNLKKKKKQPPHAHYYNQKQKHTPTKNPTICGLEPQYWANNTYSYNPVTPSSQSQNLPEKYICSSTDRGKKYQRTPDISGACVIQRPYFTIIIIHDNLEGKV